MVGTWFAAHLVADMPVGGRFGLVTDLPPVELQFETGDVLDDAVLRLTDGGAIYVQCKTHPALERGADFALAKTVAQLVAFVVDQRAKSAALIPAGLLRSSPLRRAPRDPSTPWRRHVGSSTAAGHGDVFGRVSEAQRRALDIFRQHADRAWNAKTGAATTDGTWSNSPGCSAFGASAPLPRALIGAK